MTTTINTMSAGYTFNRLSSNNNNSRNTSSPLPSPISPAIITATALPILDLLLIHLQQRDSSSSNISEGIPVLNEEERALLLSELTQLKQLTTEAQKTYITIHTTIQQYQQLVLSTHAQVAAAKRSLEQARGTNNINNSLYSNASSRAPSPPSSPTSITISAFTSMPISLCSPRSRSSSFSFAAAALSNSMTEEEREEMDEEARIRQLGQEHADLGRRLTQLLREKAAAEETKKRMNDGLLKAKARIKELERRLG